MHPTLSFPGRVHKSVPYICLSSSVLQIRFISTIFQRRQWHPTPVLLPGKSHGRRSLVGCSPWGRWGSDMTEQLHFHLSLSCIGEGNGNPLQCSSLENPRGSRAWWAAFCGVAQSRTRLKWLSSSSEVSRPLYRPVQLRSLWEWKLTQESISLLFH